MDTYQPIYDAVRTALRNTDVGAAVQEAFRMANLDFYITQASQTIQQVAWEVRDEQIRPSILFKPTLIRREGDVPKGSEWCVTLGETGRSFNAYGPTPDAAMRAFDKAWVAKDAVT